MNRNSSDDVKVAVSRTTWRRPLVLMGVHALATLVLLPPSKLEGARGGQIAVHGGVTFLCLLLLLHSVFQFRWPVVRWPGQRRNFRLLRLGIGGSWVAAVLGLSIGLLLDRWSLLHVVGDSAQWLVFPLTFALAMRCLDDEVDVKRLLEWLVLVLLVQQGREFVEIFTVLGAGSIGRLHSVYWVHSAVAVVLAIGIGLTERRAAKALPWFAVAGASMMVGAASGFRTYLAFMVIGVPIVLLAGFRTRGSRQILLISAVLGAVVLLAVPLDRVPAPDAITSPLSQAQKRLELLSSGVSNDGSANNRVLETRFALDGLDEAPLGYITGLGNGAEITIDQAEVPADSVLLGLSSKHFIHNTFVSALYRNGIIGLATVSLLLFGAVLTSLRGVRPSLNPLSVALGVATGFYLLSAPLFAFVPGDFLFPILVACVCRISSRTGPVEAGDQNAARRQNIRVPSRPA